MYSLTESYLCLDHHLRWSQANETRHFLFNIPSSGSSLPCGPWSGEHSCRHLLHRPEKGADGILVPKPYHFQLRSFHKDVWRFCFMAEPANNWSGLPPTKVGSTLPSRIALLVDNCLPSSSTKDWYIVRAPLGTYLRVAHNWAGLWHYKKLWIEEGLGECTI